MKKPKHPFKFETIPDLDILQSYMHKNAAYNNADARKIKRALRKLVFIR
jgi:hypothetical protein